MPGVYYAIVASLRCSRKLTRMNSGEEGSLKNTTQCFYSNGVPVIHVATSGLRLLEIAFVSDFLLIASVPVPFLSVMVNITHSQARCGRMLIYFVRNCINITKSL